ncbi:uncharacterized protein LOC128071137 [Budorcas taxicolor]|uniref:uncharacterized protein LOC128071137 n=1 Tax=Budorcas taxicolor TaxID=37181 RepID=UPI002284B14E|nr:uncharacterized protein LOC128071137 [Budorcas taxicolor]
MGHIQTIPAAAIMAVQAQYPSNVLLLNRTIQEGKNQPGRVSGGDGGGGGGGGGIALFDHPHILFNPGVTTNNSRKRGRETMGTTTMNGSNALISVTLQQQQQQQQQSQMIDLSQLHTPQNNPNNVVVSTGLRLAFGDQHQHQQQQQQQHHHLQHQQHYNSHQQQQTSLSPQSSVSLSILSDDFASQIKQQRDEIHHFIQVQGEQLRRELSQKRQRQYRELLVATEEAVARRLREKEVEVEKAVRRNAELEARAAQLSAEAQVWQARARAQEATAATLQAQLQQAMMGGGGGGGGCSVDRDDQWGSSNGVDGVVAEDAESAYIDPDRVAVLTGPSCKACRKRVASSVLLPCRHLCLCTECDAVAQACPLCFTFRSSSVEVNLC